MAIDDATRFGRLRQEIDSGGARPSVIDTLVADIDALPGPVPTRDLLLLLSDAADHDEGMFTLIHAAEAAALEPYVADLLAVFPQIMAKSPRWASIVLMRALNDEATRTELVRQVVDAPEQIRVSVREMCERINSVSAEFLAKTVAVMTAAR